MHPFFKQIIESTASANLPEQLAVEVSAENLLNGETRNYSPLSKIIRGLNEGFIPTGSARRHRGLRCYAGDKEIFRYCGSEERRSLVVHPNSIAKDSLNNKRELATLSASTHPFFALSSLRSVLYESEGEWRRAKLHLEDVQISRYFRNLGGRTIQHSVAVSEAIRGSWKEIQRAYQHQTTLGFYEEFAGTILANSPGDLPMKNPLRDGEWGSLARSLYPKGVGAAKMCAVPLFAFYGRQADKPSAKTLGETMIRASGESPGDFVFSRVMEPVIRSWVAVFEASGIIWEPHAQNMVLLCDMDSLEPQAIALRDADTAVSSARRKQLGLSCESFFFKNVHDATRTDELPLGDHSEISRVIDISMGRNTFDYLAGFYSDIFGGDSDELKTRCRALFEEIWPAGSRWLPAEVYGYRDTPLANDKNCYALEIKPETSPLWRSWGNQ